MACDHDAGAGRRGRRLGHEPVHLQCLGAGVLAALGRRAHRGDLPDDDLRRPRARQLDVGRGGARPVAAHEPDRLRCRAAGVRRPRSMDARAAGREPRPRVDAQGYRGACAKDRHRPAERAGGDQHRVPRRHRGPGRLRGGDAGAAPRSPARRGARLDAAARHGPSGNLDRALPQPDVARAPASPPAAHAGRPGDRGTRAAPAPPCAAAGGPRGPPWLPCTGGAPSPAAPRRRSSTATSSGRPPRCPASTSRRPSAWASARRAPTRCSPAARYHRTGQRAGRLRGNWPGEEWR